MRPGEENEAGLIPSFSAVSGMKPNREAAPETKPFSIRFTVEEREYLERLAGPQRLGAFIRQRLLDDKQSKKRRVLRKPKVDDKNLAMVLSLLGDQRIASNLNQLAKHANMGTLDCDDATLAQIHEACAAMIAVRNYFTGSSMMMVHGNKRGRGKRPCPAPAQGRE